MKLFFIFTLATALYSVNAAESCSPLYGQCGGNYWNGPTCCEYGSKCQIRSEWYHQCVYDPNPEPVPTSSSKPSPTVEPKYPCANWYGQCGGIGWTGSNCCAIGSKCQKSNNYYSGCVPILNTGPCQSIYGQCGGKYFNGPTCCQEGTECIRDSEWYSQCVAIPGVLYGVGPGNNGEAISSSTTTTFLVSSTSSKYSLSSQFTYFSNSTTRAVSTA